MHQGGEEGLFDECSFSVLKTNTSRKSPSTLGTYDILYSKGMDMTICHARGASLKFPFSAQRYVMCHYTSEAAKRNFKPAPQTRETAIFMHVFKKIVCLRFVEINKINFSS